MPFVPNDNPRIAIRSLMLMVGFPAATRAAAALLSEMLVDPLTPLLKRAVGQEILASDG